VETKGIEPSTSALRKGRHSGPEGVRGRQSATGGDRIGGYGGVRVRLSCADHPCPCHSWQQTGIRRSGVSSSRATSGSHEGQGGRLTAAAGAWVWRGTVIYRGKGDGSPPRHLPLQRADQGNPGLRLAVGHHPAIPPAGSRVISVIPLGAVLGSHGIGVRASPRPYHARGRRGAWWSALCNRSRRYRLAPERGGVLIPLH